MMLCRLIQLYAACATLQELSPLGPAGKQATFESQARFHGTVHLLLCQPTV